jgi:bacterioferritin-associated ferredoxin
MPSEVFMYVCLCVGVTDRDIENAVSDGARSWREVRETTGCAGQCGKCACTGKSIMREAISQELTMDPDLAYAV